MTLIQRGRQLAKSRLFRNIVVVASGTAAAQLINLVFTPIITRLYGPEVYGLLGIFVTVTGLVSTVGALAYPIAIVLPKENADAIGLAKLSIYIALMMAIINAIALFFAGDSLLRLLNAEAIAPFVYFIPVAMLFSVMSTVLDHWLIRNQAFKISAKYKVVTTFLVSSTKSGLGMFYPSAAVIIITNTFGIFLGTLLTLSGWVRSRGRPGISSVKQTPSLRELAQAHIDFPLLRAPHGLMSMVSRSLPILLLSGYFGASAAGQYGLAFAILGAPVILIGNSMMSVFYPRITDAVHNGENTKLLIAKASAGMASVGVLPYVIVVLAGPQIFSFGFGKEWVKAGEYAQWLSVWLLMQLVAKPAVAAIPALRLQGGLLLYEIFSSGSKVLALWLGLVVLKDDVSAIALFSVAGVIAYCWLIFWVMRKAGVTAHRIEETLRI